MNTDNLDNLIDRALDGVADAREMRRLKTLLHNDREARSAYIEGCRIRQSVADVLEGAANAEQHVLAESSNNPRNWQRTIGLLSAIAAIVAIAAISWPTDRGDTEGGPTLHASDSENVEAASSLPAIATVNRAINCVWSDSSLATGLASKITAGQTIGLERGLMSLVFKNGVNVVLEGPAEFTVIDPLHGVLELGGIGVRVPDGFSGYVVDTPSARVTDLGTEFSVRVGDRGNTSLRVIEGEVSVSERKVNGQLKGGKPELLKKDAIWNSLAQLRVPEGPPSEADFPRVSLLEDPVADSTPALPVMDSRLLWLRADLAVKLGVVGHVIAWGDISSDEARNRHSAWQVEAQRRPEWISDGIGGQASIRFDGVNDFLATEPFRNGNQQTIVVVARLNQLKGKRVKSAIPAQQILNYNGPPHLVLEYRWPIQALRARAFGGYESEQQLAGLVKARPISKEETLAIVYVYDHKADYSAFYLNAELQGEKDAGIPISNSRPKVIGLHRRRWSGGLVGDVAEVIIYDRVMTRNEIAATFAYLEERYGPLQGELPEVSVAQLEQSAATAEP